MRISLFRILLCLAFITTSSWAEVPDHPRLLFSKSDETAVKQGIHSDPLAKQVYTEILRRADHTLNAPTCRYHIPDGKRLLGESRRALSNILHCAMAWRLSGEKKYFNRTIKELDAACALKDWNPKHFLDTAEMSTAVAIGYDWLYHELNETQRNTYASALRNKGLEPARNGFTGKRAWWSHPRNNWGQVCATGLLMAERALERSGDHIHPARKAASQSLEQCATFYQPDGAYPEGPAYWHYGSNYHVIGLALLATEHRQLRSPTPATFARSPLFTEHLTGPTGKVFNFADAGVSTSRVSPAQSWMTNTFDQPATCKFIRSRIAQDISDQRKHSTKGPERFFPLHLLWLPNEHPDKQATLATDSRWNGSQPIATFRSQWHDPDALFVAIKGGYPGASHGQMDVGTFILESQGVRWVEDLGSDNYNMPGYFGSKRWSYFRLTNKSHSTLVINQQLQNPKSKPCLITAFQSTPEKGSASIDLTQAYTPQAKHIVRSCTLDRSRQQVTIEDAITQPTGPVRWAIVTRAEVNIENNTAILKQSGKELKIIRNDKHGGVWQVLDAKPSLKIENQNQGVRILCFTAPASPQLTLSVSFSPH
ncbi:heparinase II/III family protein [Verrucomicrobiaceae bacterium N1E253]|uniref:Heparinase II/III family protein n=1 Tax=Oceaniferula marina TaxID=2748318 RepID=A0A851GI23_9BACT|nr:heparinase II/III family protein [Oceaniferula marina]NWK56552.1 heparinase II/III family protein [Oceaniferula marina]